MTRKLLKMAGIKRERLHLEWVSSAEAQRFAEIASRIVESIRMVGPMDLVSLGLQLEACEMTLNSENIRWLVGKELKITSKGDVYGRQWEVRDYESFLDHLLEREYHKNLIYLSVKEGHESVRDISRRTGLDLKRVSYLLADLEKTNRVEFRGMKEKRPIFAAL